MSEQPTTDLPTFTNCISCNKAMNFVHEPVSTGPSDGVYLSFRTRGNYGSTVFDNFDEYAIEGHLCDECLVSKLDRLWILQKGDLTGQRLLDHADGQHMARRLQHGPVERRAYDQRYQHGVYWIPGVQTYASMTSAQRSRIDNLLTAGDGLEPTLGRALHDALIELEQRYIVQYVKWLDERGKVYTLETQLGSPVPLPTYEHLLDKEAEALTIDELRKLRQVAAWHSKMERWLQENTIYDENGVPVDMYAVYERLMLGTDTSAKLREIFEAQGPLAPSAPDVTD